MGGGGGGDTRSEHNLIDVNLRGCIGVAIVENQGVSISNSSGHVILLQVDGNELPRGCYRDRNPGIAESNCNAGIRRIRTNVERDGLEDSLPLEIHSSSHLPQLLVLTFVDIV